MKSNMMIQCLLMACCPFIISGVFCAEAAGADKDPNTFTIVMMGDSTTLSRKSPEPDKLTSCVQSRFAAALRKGKNIVIINAGVGGDTAVGALKRLQADVLDKKPDMISLSFGLNDTGGNPDTFRASLEKLIITIKEKSSAKLLLITSTPFDNKRHSWGKSGKYKPTLDEYMDANICQHMRDLALAHKLPLLDLHQIFAEAFKEDPELINTSIHPDGVHLTAAANNMAATHIVPALVSLGGQEFRHWHNLELIRSGVSLPIELESSGLADDLDKFNKKLGDAKERFQKDANKSMEKLLKALKKSEKKMSDEQLKALAELRVRIREEAGSL